MPSFIVHTLGCKLNQLESEAIADIFIQAGFIETIENDTPSFIVINTCTVTSKADQKARRIIRKVLRDYPDSNVLVTGCYAQLDKDELQKLDIRTPPRLFIIKKDEILDFIDKKFLENISHRGTETRSLINEKEIKYKNQITLDDLSASVSPCDKKTIFQFEFNPERFSSHTRSFLKIQDGCDNKCTYCRTRLARGPSISLDADEVLSRLRILEKNHAEAVITGVNICQYKCSDFFTTNSNLRFVHEHTKSNLHDLLTYLLNNTEKINIRLSSLDPQNIDENLVKVLSHKRIRPHFHLSIQSGSNEILGKMGRNYNEKIAQEAVSMLRSAKGDPFLACDIITGFPGETNTEFLQTLDMCKKLDFAWIHVFPFSKRPGTSAFSFKNNVTESEVSERILLLTDLAWQGRASYIKRWIGRDVDVLIENKQQEKNCKGISENYLKVLVQAKGNSYPAGTVLRCKLIESNLQQKYENFDVKAVIIE